MKSEKSESGEGCRTNVPNRRYTMRSYPPGTALFIDGKCFCDGIHETIHEYAPSPWSTTDATAISQDNNINSDRSKTVTGHHRFPSNGRIIIGNYGSLVFSGGVQMLNLLNVINDGGKYVCCNCPLTNNGKSAANLLANPPAHFVKFPCQLSKSNNTATITPDFTMTDIPGLSSSFDDNNYSETTANTFEISSALNETPLPEIWTDVMYEDNGKMSTNIQCYDANK